MYSRTHSLATPREERSVITFRKEKNSSKGEKVKKKKKVLIVAYFEVEDEKVQSASFK